MASKKLPRGIANNNPGNIEKTKPQDPWQGMSKTQSDVRFLQFDKPVFGIRAMVRILNTYRVKGIDTIQNIVDHWAPAKDHNDVVAYTNALCKAVKVGPVDRIDVRDVKVIVPLLCAIIQHENGMQPYSLELIYEAINLAK